MGRQMEGESTGRNDWSCGVQWGNPVQRELLGTYEGDPREDS